jgi:hypothetical protein
MKKNFSWISLLLVPIASANQPTIVGHIPNQAGSKITFTTERGDCPEYQLIVYGQQKGGRIGITGCYRLIDDELFVVWSDGDVFTYPFDALVFTQEFERHVREGARSETF